MAKFFEKVVVRVCVNAIIKPQITETSEQIAKFCAVSPVEIIELNIFTP